MAMTKIIRMVWIVIWSQVKIHDWWICLLGGCFSPRAPRAKICIWIWICIFCSDRSSYSDDVRVLVRRPQLCQTYIFWFICVCIMRMLRFSRYLRQNAVNGVSEATKTVFCIKNHVTHVSTSLRTKKWGLRTQNKGVKTEDWRLKTEDWGLRTLKLPQITSQYSEVRRSTSK